MKRFVSLLLVVTFIFSFTILLAQTPKPILQELYDVGGSYPDNIIYPEAGTIEYQVWMIARPGDVQYGPSGIMSAGMDQGKFLLQFNMGNFSFPWAAGELLQIEVLQTNTGRTASAQFSVSSGTSPQARFDENAIVLQNPPMVLFDSRPDVLDPIYTTANLMPGYPQAGIYRANNWVSVSVGDPANSNWNISFSTEDVVSNLHVTSKIRRANYFDEDELFDDVQGPRTFRTYYSIDNGLTWVNYPVVNHILPVEGEDWMIIDFDLPEDCIGLQNVQLQWRLYASGGSTVTTYPNEAWGEIKDVVVTGIGEEETPVFTISTFPWTEGFEDDSLTRPFWSQIQVAGSALWTYVNGAQGGAITSAYQV